jgi:hypothetical protein
VRYGLLATLAAHCIGGFELAKREDLEEWVYEALRRHGGEASLLDVAKYIWNEHEDDLRASGNLFYSWQYDMRWAAQRLRDKGKLVSADLGPRGIWAIAPSGH